MEARATSYDHHILRRSKSMDDKAVWAARGPRRRSGSEESEVARERLSEAICDAWLAFACLDFWVFLAGGLGARLWDRFRQAKA